MTRFIAIVFALAFGAAAAQHQPLGAADSLDVNPQGIGHLLVVPYFSAQGGNSTLLNIFNTGSTAKAVKIRFRGAGNGDDLASLQVFLRARDAWSVNVSTGADGLPVLTTADRSCTLPAVVSGQKFSTVRLNPALAGDALANQAREGYVEIIALGDVIYGTPLNTAITHVKGTPPCTPSVLGALARFDVQLAPPTSGLMANWILINVPQTTTWSGEALAYEARLDGAASTGNVMFFPQTAAPLTVQDVTDYSADPLFNFANGGPIVVPRSADLPDLSTPYTAAVLSPQDQATELSYAIAAQETVVEYLTDPTIYASTDWVLSMPTKRYHVAVDYRGPTGINNAGTFGNPEAKYFTGLGTNLSAPAAVCGLITQQLSLRGHDREGNWISAQPIAPFFTFLPICGAVSVISVNGEFDPPSTTLKAAVTRSRYADAGLSGADGIVTISWPTKSMPVLVRQFSRAVNPSVAPGVSGTFGATAPGRTTKWGVLP